jgi:signal transduction histidine kinase
MIIDPFNIPLFVTDISYTFFFILTVLFGLWVYLKSSHKTLHIMFLFMCLAVGVYQISHVFGITVVNSEASRSIFTLSLSIIFVGCFTVHWIAAAIEREKEYFWTILSMYAGAVGLVTFYIVKPASFLLQSVPKLYFPNYYVAGNYYWLLVAYFALVFVLVLRMLLKSYTISDALHKNRLSYYIFAILIGYPLATFGFFLTYNVQIDPIFSVPFNFFIIPLAYGVLRYDIMDVKTAARKAFSYAVFVLGTAFFILGANLGNNFLATAYPAVPEWILPLISSLLIVLFAGFIWERVRDLETLKYEFITVVTHKFRTPLTRIKWSSEILRKEGEINEEQKSALSEIENANEHLVSLTDVLLNLRKANDSAFQYEFETYDICNLIDSTVKNVSKRVKDREMDFSVVCPELHANVSLDKRRLSFALQIVIDNALTYTPKQGKISITVSKENSSVFIKVKDSGIGIAKDDMSRVFSKFWRSKEAKTTDTEGMGIGLFMAREIIERHDGEIYVQSEGVGKGSTFVIKLPQAQE